ncbi:MAG: hypothetical protein MUF64_31515 [Polyangiaceae bacterium]|jgi:hypothetical protein|nr:hypothetical protein [Polyangiaceae bacterium]
MEATEAPAWGRVTDDFWPRLLHRWFVQYNPLYLLSAALVLAGLTLVSRGLAGANHLAAATAVGALSELYAWALIGAAALLRRGGQRRSAVQLGLLAALYQCDLTLLTESAGMAGLSGVLPASLWLTVALLKLRALGWALRIRLERRAALVVAGGLAGLAGLPFLVYRVGSYPAGLLLGLYVFALLAALPAELGASARSLDALDDWGQTVLRRASWATWALWGVAFSLHLLCWSVQAPFAMEQVLLALAAYLAARRASEGQLWFLAGLAVLVSLLINAPPGKVALWISLAMTLRALSPRTVRAPAFVAPGPVDASPYREDTPAAPVPPAIETVAEISPQERARLLLGALLAAYLAVWIPQMCFGIPEHLPLPALVLVALNLLAAWKLRTILGLIFAPIVPAHALLTWQDLPRPHGSIEWGLTLLSLGFLVLGGAVLASRWVIRKFSALTAPEVPVRPPTEAQEG